MHLLYYRHIQLDICGSFKQATSSNSRSNSRPCSTLLYVASICLQLCNNTSMPINSLSLSLSLSILACDWLVIDHDLWNRLRFNSVGCSHATSTFPDTNITH